MDTVKVPADGIELISFCSDATILAFILKIVVYVLSFTFTHNNRENYQKVWSNFVYINDISFYYLMGLFGTLWLLK